MDRGAASTGAWLRRCLLVLAVVWVLVMPVANPSSGTAVNLHHNDAAAAVRADHHAKTLPGLVAAVVVLTVITLASRLRAFDAVVPSTVAVTRWTRFDDAGSSAGAGTLWRASVARRGPPALV